MVYALLKSGIAYDRSIIEHAIEGRWEQAAHAARRQTAKPFQPHQFNCLFARAALNCPLFRPDTGASRRA